MAKKLVFEVGTITLDPLCSGTLWSPPTYPGTVCYPTGFLISGDTDDVLVTDIKVGNNFQFYSTGAAPASFFTKFAHKLDLKFDPVEHGKVISVSFQNVGYVPATLKVMVVCGQQPSSTPLVVLGLGRTKLTGSLQLRIEPMMSVLPELLYVPGGLLAEIEINSVQCGPYLNHQKVSKVPDSQLCKDSLISGGNIRLKPYRAVGNRTYLTITTTTMNRSRKDLSFCGVVVASLLPNQ